MLFFTLLSLKVNLFLNYQNKGNGSCGLYIFQLFLFFKSLYKKSWAFLILENAVF